VSVPANIAEGWGRQVTKEFIQFLRLAQGSLNELETHLILAQRLEMLPTDAVSVFQRVESVGKILLSLIRSLERRMPLPK
jgi:four helix bundle protein